MLLAACASDYCIYNVPVFTVVSKKTLLFFFHSKNWSKVSKWRQEDEDKERDKGKKSKFNQIF